MWMRSRSHSISSIISETLMKLGVLNTLAAYISSLTKWIFFSLTKLTRLLNVSLSKTVPKGFDGFAMIKPFTLILSCWALSYAASNAAFVIRKLFELSQLTGISCTPVRHPQSRSNLHSNTKFIKQLSFNFSFKF